MASGMTHLLLHSCLKGTKLLKITYNKVLNYLQFVFYVYHQKGDYMDLHTVTVSPIHLTHTQSALGICYSGTTISFFCCA